VRLGSRPPKRRDELVSREDEYEQQMKNKSLLLTSVMFLEKTKLLVPESKMTLGMSLFTRLAGIACPLTVRPCPAERSDHVIGPA
jgi:hypothetical protein